MTRVLRIVLIIAFIVLLAFWFSGIFKSCGNDKEPKAVTETTEMVDTSTVFDDLGDEFLDEDLSGTTENTGTTGSQQKVETSYSDAELESFTDYTGTDIPKSKSGPAAGSKTMDQPKASSSGNSSGGNYIIVAGSFLVEANAIELRDRLISQGYNAEVKSFDLSQYHSVIAGRFSTQSEANSVAAEMKSKGFSCYVKKREL